MTIASQFCLVMHQPMATLGIENAAVALQLPIACTTRATIATTTATVASTTTATIARTTTATIASIDSNYRL